MIVGHRVLGKVDVALLEAEYVEGVEAVGADVPGASGLEQRVP